MKLQFDKLALMPSLAVAGGMHVIAIAAFLSAAERPGAGARETLAVSLNLIETMVVDEVAPAPDDGREGGLPLPAAPRSAAAESNDQAKLDTLEAAPANAVDPPPITETPSPPRVEQGPGDAESPAVPAPARKPERAEQKDQNVTDRAEKTPEASPREQRKKPVAAKSSPSAASAPSRASKRSATRHARLSASPGDVRGYAAMVRARIARNRPRNGRRAGTVVISFAVSRSGALRYARLSRSSGNSALDSAALRSVRAAAPFPAPPKAMTSRQLSFVIPFHFR